MTAVSKGFFSILLLGSAFPTYASSITNISFMTNAGGYTNDTIANGSTSPLGITAKQAFRSHF